MNLTWPWSSSASWPSGVNSPIWPPISSSAKVPSSVLSSPDRLNTARRSSLWSSEVDLAIGIFLVPGGPILLHGHAEIHRIVQFGRRNVGEDVLERLLADILFQKLRLDAGIDREQHLELGADVLDVTQEGDVVRRVAEM